jgi:hypothetical protein
LSCSHPTPVPSQGGDAYHLVHAAYEGLGDIRAAAGSPLSNDEFVEYIITRLSKEYNAITASLMLGNKYVPYDEFYSHILSFKALQEQQD